MYLIGNGGFFFDNIDPIIWKNGDLGYEVVKYLDREKNGLVWLKPASANNTWAIATRKDLAEKENIYTLEDFGLTVTKGKKITVNIPIMAPSIRTCSRFITPGFLSMKCYFINPFSFKYS